MSLACFCKAARIISLTSLTMGAASPPNASRSTVSLLPSPVSRTMARPNSAVTSSSAFWPSSHFLSSSSMASAGLTTKSISHLRQHAKLLLKLEIVRPAGGDHEHVALRPERRHAKPPRVGGGQAQERFRRYSPARKVVEGQTEFGGKLRSHAWPALLCLDAEKDPLTPALSHPHPLADAETLKCQLAKASWRGEGVDRGPGPTAEGQFGRPPLPSGRGTG